MPKTRKTKTTPQKRKSSTASSTPAKKKAKTETPKSTKSTNGKKNGVAIKKDPDSKATPTKKPANSAEANDTTVAVKTEVKKEESEGPYDDEEDYKWWEQINEDDSIKWNTLEHSGVLFPPDYEPLPKNVHLIYDKKPIKLPLEAEEVAGFFGAMIETDHAKNPVFQKNFFNDFLAVLKETGEPAIDKNTNQPVEIKEFEKCDFSVMYKHFQALREQRRNLPTSEKKRLKAERDQIEAPYKEAILNGRKEMVGNFRIEPPGLFRGRGAHPKTGKLKRRVRPEDITINIGKEAKVPEPPAGHKWAKVQHDNTVAWLATWRENINGNTKYVMLAANSSLKGKSDFTKFEKARKLKDYIEKIREDYRKELKDKVMLNRQRATATYLIDKLALRAGGEKGEDEADTVGCCSLRYEHVSLKPPNIVVFDFLGKDSVPYHNEQEVDEQVFKNLKIFKKPPKGPGDQIFDRLDPTILNRHLQNYMPGLTAKVFRTYNATYTMQQQIDKIPNTGTIAEKVVKYNAANREVAILCNHQKAVGRTHESTIEKIEDRIKTLKWKRIIAQRKLVSLDSSLKKKRKDLFVGMTEFNQKDLVAIVNQHFASEIERTTKRFERLLEMQKIEKVEPEKKVTKKDMNEKIQLLKQQRKDAIEEAKKKVYEGNVGTTAEKLIVQIEKLTEQIGNTILNKQDKEANSNVALGTSKLNYIDPRLTVMFSKKYGVPLDKLFGKSMREKFKWAIESADENWRF